MSTSITFNGVGYTIPAEGDNYGDDLSSYLVAIASGALQKTGGTFTLSAEVNFGATYGLKSVYLKSQAAVNPASNGIVRLGNAENISWRNQANNADLSISVNASNKFTFNSIELADISSAQTLTNKTLTAPVISSPSGLVSADVGLGNVDNTSDATKNSAVATLINKTLTSPVINSPTGLVKADVGLGNVDNTSDATKNAAAATLTNKTIDAASNTISNISNSNISASAAIAYSKLASMTGGSILLGNVSNVPTVTAVTGDVTISNSGVTAIASGVIVNADVNTSAAIALSKLAATTTNRALASDGSGFITVSATTATELAYVSGVTSAIQTQLNSKASLTGTEVLTNKDFDGGTASNSRRLTLPKDTLTNLTALTRKQGTLVFDTTNSRPVYDNGSSLVAIQTAASPVLVYATKTGGDNNGASGINSFNSPSTDSVSGFNATTGEYTIQSGYDGNYIFKLEVEWSAPQGIAWIFLKNGSSVGLYGDGTASSYYVEKQHLFIGLVAGDIIKVISSTGSNVSISSAVFYGYKL